MKNINCRQPLPLRPAIHRHSVTLMAEPPTIRPAFGAVFVLSVLICGAIGLWGVLAPDAVAAAANALTGFALTTLDWLRPAAFHATMTGSPPRPGDSGERSISSGAPTARLKGPAGPLAWLIP
ncbi:MAG: hypothetical protein VBE63_24450 [Lamprobacter sp.]|uniref:hypothetical protein n=1 Tax=Lamprobacter sp. TaxID=3100796 RepID=UPI002B25B2EE|nr:hypothetical protein [Lamprobacter sp.]MEA3643066.1 hypothetical protein [Lamprobacter sp.]